MNKPTRAIQQCKRCSQQSDSKFTVFEPMQDAMIAYPDQQLIHIHFGITLADDDLNIEEAKAMEQFLKKTVADNPDTVFFIVGDMSTGNDSEFVPPESLKIYRDILKHPHTRDGVIYGGTYAMNELLSLLFSVTKTNVKLARTQEEAEEIYQQWLAQQKQPD